MDQDFAYFRSCSLIPALRGTVEWRCGAVTVDSSQRLPPLSSGGASIDGPWLRFHIPLIEPDRPY
jgi:hypothetical protein